MAGEKGPVLLLALTFVFSGGGEFGFRTAFRTHPTKVFSSSAVHFSEFRAINCNRNDMVPISVQYFVRKSCKFAGFLTLKMLVAFGLRAVNHWPVAHGGRISKCAMLAGCVSGVHG